MEKKIRNSNLELLRIIAMFMVVLLHFGTFGIQKEINVNTDFSSYDQFLYHLTRSFSIVAVNVYVLISAYFLCKSSFKKEKLVRLFLETSFFAVVLLFGNILFNTASFEIQSLKEVLFAVVYKEYWFVTTFFLLILVSPYLNKLINALTQKEHFNLILISFIVCSIWGYFINISVLGLQNGYSLISFIFLYILSAYIRNYKAIYKNLKPIYYLLLFVFLGLMNVFIINQFIIDGEGYGQWYRYNSPIVILMSYSLIKYFLALKIQSNKINFMAQYVFGIYLIHEFPIVRQELWIESNLIEYVLSLSDRFVMPFVLVGNLGLFFVLWVLSFVLGYLFNFLYKKMKVVFVDSKQI